MNTFKKGQWVIVPDGRVGKITIAYDNNSYDVEFNGIVESMPIDASELKPSPNTWQTLEVGDIIVSNNGKAKVLAIMGEVLIRSYWDRYEKASGDIYTIEEAKIYNWTIENSSDDEVQKAIELLKSKGRIVNGKIIK